MKQKPKLPKAMFESTKLEFARALAHMALLWLVPAWLAVTVANTDAHWLVKAVVFCVCGWLSGNGIVLTQWIGHDAVHGSLPVNRKFGMWLSLALSSVIVGFQNMGFAALHLDHHRYCNTDRDADTRHYREFRTAWSRVLFSRVTKNFKYMLAAADAWRGQTTLPEFTQREIRQMVIGNAAFGIAWLLIYSVLAIYDFTWFLALVALPSISLLLATGPLTYQQHAGTDQEDVNDYWRTARSMTSPFWSFLYGGGNFHLEHHLYPGIPAWRLRKVHRYLKQQGCFDQERIYLAPESLGGYRYSLGRYAYPDGKA